MGVVSGLGGYFKRRLGRSEYGRLNQVAGEANEDARKALTPGEVSKEEALSAWRGRYDDGGRARFAAVMQEQQIDENDIREREKMLRQSGVVYVIGSVLTSAGMVYWSLNSYGVMSTVGLLAFVAVILMFLALAFRSDLAAWQIRERRFAGIREYFSRRFSS